MVKVITYGTYDLLHYGHVRLLERAKALGDYLIVGVTSDTFDRERGKINVQQSLMERVEAVSDALYVISAPEKHYAQIREALQKGKHVLCESPVTMETEQWEELRQMAKDRQLVLMDSIKTAYSVAYYRLLLLAKGGVIGDIISVDATCTSLVDFDPTQDAQKSLYEWNSICAWGPTALLPIFQLLGTGFTSKQIVTHFLDEHQKYDAFTKISLVYPHAVASLKVGQGVKSEGSLVENRLLRGEIRESAEQQALFLSVGRRGLAL